MNAVIRAYTLSECMEVMSEYAEAYEEQGGKNLIFCEDRLTLVAERALLARRGGTFQSSVSTFARFLKTDGRTISKQGSVMAVGEVMTRLQRENKLHCFQSVAGIGNNARCIYETLAQMSASEITPEVLRESLALLPEDMLKRKVADLAEIYEGYLEFLYSGSYLDESKYLTLLPKRIREEGILKGYNVFFLGYTSFTAQARETIRAALETADNVVGIFCGGEEEIYSNRAFTTFQTVCKEFGKPQVLDRGIALSGEAELLRKGLFDPVIKDKPVPTDKVRIYETKDKTEEAENVAAKIRREMDTHPEMRYRDFAVLVPNVANYTLPLKKTFSEYGIPFIIDEKKSLKRHPLSAFLLSCFRVVREKYSSVSVQALTQNVFFGESDEYRNYLLKFANYRGGAKRPIKTEESVTKLFHIPTLENGRERLLAATEGIKQNAKGRAYCLAVRAILEKFDVENRLKGFSAALEDVAHKGYLSQIFRALEGVLCEAELLTGDKEMSVAEFEAVLQDGLDATEISLIPMKSDAVFIGDITDSRIEKVRVLFALGLTEEVPRSSGDTAIVSDKEIQRLAEVKALLEPTVAEVNLRNRESACLNLCTFLDKLYLSYPLGSDGDEPATSDIFRYLDKIFCEENGDKLLRRKEYDEGDFAYKCAAPAPAIRQLLIKKGEFEGKQKDTRKAYSSLFTALDKLGVQEKDDYLKEEKEIECIANGEALFFHDGRISPTSLEGYFSCPFKHFAERGLKLKEREETTVLAVDSGNFVHELLEDTVPKTPEFATEEDLREYATERGAELMKKSVYAVQQDTSSGAYFSDKLLKEGVDVAAAAYRQVKNSEYVVEKTEYGVAEDFFHGNVDRVDGTDKYVRIIDYKTGKIDDSATAYYTGRKLQMQLYMSALKGDRIPAGVFYFPAAVDYTDDNDGRFRMKGFMNGDEAALLAGDKNLTGGKKSEYFPSALKNPPAVKRVMDEGTFRDFLDYAVLVARQGAEEVKAGYIAPTPYDEDCEYCKYGGMCGFHKDVAKPRKENSIEPGAVAEIARKKRDGEEV